MKIDSKYHYLIIGVVCFFTFFIHNNTLPADLMESRNLATAQEMVHTGNYLIPTMNGELRLEKPPLPTWIAAAVEHVLPFNLSAQRAMTGLAATLMVFFLFLLVRRLTGHRNLALISALVLATCYNVIMMGRTATWDIYCHSFMLGAIYFLVCAFDTPGPQWARLSVAGAFMGLSFLSKGPVSFFALLVPFLVGYIVCVRPSVKGKVGPVVLMIFVCLAVSLWWPLWIAAFHPEAGSAVAAQESGAWLNHNVRPLWYYWKFPAEAGVWALFWVSSLLYFFVRKGVQGRSVFRMSVIWTIAAFVLLSLVPEKKTRYLLPMLIPGSINIAYYIWYSIRSMTSTAEKIMFRINGVVVGVIALAVPVVLWYIMSITEMRTGLLIVSTVVFLCIGIGILANLFGSHGIRPGRVFAGVVVMMVCFMAFAYTLAPRLLVNEHRHSIAAVRSMPQVEGLEFYMPEGEFIRMELVYESGRNISPIDLGDRQTVESLAPMVLLLDVGQDSLLTRMNLSYEHLGTFDNNWKKRESRRYNHDLAKSVYVVKAD